MGWTKGEIVRKAYAELALAGYVFDLEPEEIQNAMTSMDAMMAEHESRGMAMGYAYALTPDDADETVDANIPLKYVGWAYSELALRIAGTKGKAPPLTLLRSAKSAFDAMVSDMARNQVQQVQYPNTTPRGQGAKPWRVTNRPFMSRPDTSTVQTGEDGNLDFLGN